METNQQIMNSTKTETGTEKCEQCGRVLPKSEIRYTDLYCLNLCKDCEKQLAIQMVDCDRELAEKGDL